MLKYLSIPEEIHPAALLGLCFMAGSLSSLAMAPHNVWPLLFVGLSALYIALTKTKSAKMAFFAGWLFAFGYFLFGLSWIGNALMVEGNPYKWAWPLAVSGLPALLAIFTGIACALSKRFFTLTSTPGFFAFATCLALFEWIRGHIFTGFPWNLYGYTWADILPVVQVVALSNVYLLTWLTILWSAALGFVLIKTTQKRSKIIVGLLAVFTFALTYGYGAVRINSYVPEYHEDIQIRMVQPNIDQADKWNRSKMTEHFFKQVRLSYPTENAPDKTTYIIWPETALSHWYLNDASYLNVITQALSSYDGGAYLFTGLMNREADGTYHNALISLNAKGEITNRYDKQHLVPFGEYIPFQKWIPLKPVVEFSGFQKGKTARTFETPQGLSYMPLICYEIIFPGLIRSASETPDFILNVTNDGWYGISGGPYQHLTQAVFRAVETGVPVIRVANTGISALINPVGHIEERTELFKESSPINLLPKKNVVIVKSAYSENAIILGLMLVFLLTGFWLERKTNRAK